MGAKTLVMNITNHWTDCCCLQSTVAKVDDFMEGPAKGLQSPSVAHSLEGFSKCSNAPWVKSMFHVRQESPIDDLIEECPHFLRPKGISSHRWRQIVTIPKYRSGLSNARRKGISCRHRHLGGQEALGNGPSIMPWGQCPQPGPN